MLTMLFYFIVTSVPFSTGYMHRWQALQYNLSSWSTITGSQKNKGGETTMLHIDHSVFIFTSSNSFIYETEEDSWAEMFLFWNRICS